MSTKKILLAGATVLGAALPPHVMYAMSEDGNLWNPALFGTMLVAAVVSFASFVTCRIYLSRKGNQILLGTLCSYFMLILLVFVTAIATGDLAETLMWFPIMLIFGIPYLVPLIVLAWLASVILLPNQRGGPNKAIEGTGDPLRGSAP